MGPRHDQRRSFRPLLEALESRALLSVCTVDQLTDAGEGEKMAGDLRYCLSQAQDGDSIQFAVTGAITLRTPLPGLDRNVSIDGPGADRLTVRSGGLHRVFRVDPGATVRITGLTIRDGASAPISTSEFGGGILNNGELFLAGCTVSDNAVVTVVPSGGTRGTGGGIQNAGTLVIVDSTIRDNRVVAATAGGGGFAAGGGISSSGTLTVIRSTVSGNRSTGGGRQSGNGYGGGIHSTGTLTVIDSTVSDNVAISSHNAGGGGIQIQGGAATVSNSTVSRNTASMTGPFADRSTGGGIHVSAFAILSLTGSTVTANWLPETSVLGGGGISVSDSTVAVRNTVLAGNRAPTAADVRGTLESQGHNLVGDSRGGDGYSVTDLLDVDSLLGPLQDNGGPTPTHALLPDSPAIDAGDNTDAPKFDQRGLPRVTGNVLDVGAYEVLPGPAAYFYLYAPGNAIAGVPFDLAVFAYDADGYRATTSASTVAFYTPTDPDAVLPEPYTFTEADAGAVYLPESATLYAEGWQDVYAYDIETFAFGAAGVEVFPPGTPSPSFLYRSDVAALLALLRSSESRWRP